MAALINIGQILAPQGNKGEVRIWPLTDSLERFDRLHRVVLAQQEADSGQPMCIEAVRTQGRFVIIKFAGVNTIDGAETLRGLYIKIAREELEPLPPGRYYIFEVLGLEVYDTEGNYLGQVVDYLLTGLNDCFIIKHAATSHEFMVPAAREFVRKMDWAGGKMVIKIIPGLL